MEVRIAMEMLKWHSSISYKRLPCLIHESQEKYYNHFESSPLYFVLQRIDISWLYFGPPMTSRLKKYDRLPFTTRTRPLGLKRK